VTVGYLQNPILSEYIDVVAASSSELRPGSLSGSMAQSSGSTSLRFSGVPGTSRVFLDSTQQLKGSGTVSLRVRGAKKYGIFYSDTTVTFNARLLKVDEPATISTPSGAFTLSLGVGSVTTPLYVTAFDGNSDPNTTFSRSLPSSGVFAVGPSNFLLSRPSTVRIAGAEVDGTSTLAQYRNGKWLAIPSTVDRAGGELTASVNRLGLFSILKKSEVDGQADDLPARFALEQNYPNPFNPVTAISYQLSAVSVVTLRVYDVLGREVSILVNGVGEPGVHTVQWNGKNDRGETVSSGIYLYQLRTGNLVMTRKMVLLK
jgi:FlgD Ig-like domain